MQKSLPLFILIAVLIISVLSCKPRMDESSGLLSNSSQRWTALTVAEDFKNSASIRAKLIEIKNSHQVDLDGALEMISKDDAFNWVFQDVALMYRSNSLSSEDITFPHLRIISFHENSILAITTNTEGEFYNVAEIIEFGSDNKFHFSLVDFTKEQSFSHMTQENTCAHCHGEIDPRPIYGAYDFWPLFLSSQDHSEPTSPGGIAFEEKRTWEKLCRDNRSGDLSKRLKLFSKGVGVHCGDQISNYEELDRYGAGVGRPRGFTLALSKIQALRFYRELTKPAMKPYWPAIAGVFAGCEVESWFPDAAFASVIDSTRKSIFDEHYRRASLHFSSNVSNFDKERIVFHKTSGYDRDYRYYYILPPNLPSQLKLLETAPYPIQQNGEALRPMTDFIPVTYSNLAQNLDLKILATARLRYVLEKKANMDISDWSFSRGISESSYDLNMNGQGAQAVADVVSYGLLNLVLGKDLIYDLEYGAFGVSKSRSKNCDLLESKYKFTTKK